MRITMVQILRPDFQNLTRNRQPITPTLSDYITVPRLSTHGEWTVVDLLPMETLAKVSMLRDSLAGVKRRK